MADEWARNGRQCTETRPPRKGGQSYEIMDLKVEGWAPFPLQTLFSLIGKQWPQTWFPCLSEGVAHREALGNKIFRFNHILPTPPLHSTAEVSLITPYCFLSACPTTLHRLSSMWPCTHGIAFLTWFSQTLSSPICERVQKCKDYFWLHIEVLLVYVVAHCFLRLLETHVCPYISVPHVSAVIIVGINFRNWVSVFTQLSTWTVCFQILWNLAYFCG